MNRDLLIALRDFIAFLIYGAGVIAAVRVGEAWWGGLV